MDQISVVQAPRHSLHHSHSSCRSCCSCAFENVNSLVLRLSLICSAAYGRSSDSSHDFGVWSCPPGDCPGWVAADADDTHHHQLHGCNQHTRLGRKANWHFSWNQAAVEHQPFASWIGGSNLGEKSLLHCPQHSHMLTTSKRPAAGCTLPHLVGWVAPVACVACNTLPSVIGHCLQMVKRLTRAVQDLHTKTTYLIHPHAHTYCPHPWTSAQVYAYDLSTKSEEHMVCAQLVICVLMAGNATV